MAIAFDATSVETDVGVVYYGNQARVQITLTDGSKYWRVKGEVKWSI